MSDDENIPSIPSRPWTEAKAELIRLFREGEVDYYQLKAEEIKEVHTRHFSDQKLSNFYQNFRRLAKAFGAGVRKDGARREAAGEEDNEFDKEEDEAGDDDDDHDNIMPPSSTSTARVRSTPATGKSTGDVPVPVAKKPKSKSASGPVLDIINNRPYTYSLDDGSFVAYYTDDDIYFDCVFLVDGVMATNARRLSIGPDCRTVTFQRGIDYKAYSKATLKLLLAGDGKPFHKNHNRTIAYDSATIHEMAKDGIKPDSAGLYWGRKHVIMLKDKALAEPEEISWQPYESGVTIEGHPQYNTIVLCRVRMADQRLTKHSKGTNKKPVAFGFSQDSDAGLPPPPAANNRPTGGGGGGRGGGGGGGGGHRHNRNNNQQQYNRHQQQYNQIQEEQEEEEEDDDDEAEQEQEEESQEY